MADGVAAVAAGNGDVAVGDLAVGGAVAAHLVDGFGDLEHALAVAFG